MVDPDEHEIAGIRRAASRVAGEIALASSIGQERELRRCVTEAERADASWRCVDQAALQRPKPPRGYAANAAIATNREAPRARRVRRR